jgi:quinol monooxygenase YgiN
MAFVLVARMTAREGEEDRAAELIGRLAEASGAEPGNVHYIPHRDREDPRVFLIYEQYRDEAAFQEHGQTEHFKTLAAGELFGLMESRERSFYETLD